MAKVKTFKTIFPAVSVPLNDDYSINEEEFRVYVPSARELPRSALKSAAM